MNVRDLVPWNRDGERNRPSLSTRGGESSLLTLHREMNRLFDEAFRGFDLPTLWGGRAGWPQIEVEDVETEYRISVEVPGLDERDVEVLVQDGVLILRGEKRAETHDRNRAFSERVYGRFERRLTLEGVDENLIQAHFRNGLLTVTAPKSAQIRERGRRISINQIPESTH